MSLIGNAIKRMTGTSAAAAPESLETTVDHIVKTSVDDAKSSIAALLAEESKSTEDRLRILRAALEAEKEGQARSSLLTLIRSAIRSQEKAAEGEEEVLPVVYGAEADDDLVVVQEAGDPAEGTQPEVIPPKPERGMSADLTLDEFGSLPRVAPLSAFAIHPDLEAIAMIEEAHQWLAKNHHGDTARKEASEDLSKDWEAFVDEIREHGVREAVKVVAVSEADRAKYPASVKWLIADGRHRFAGSTQAGLEILPFESVHPSQVRAIIEGTIAARRNYTKGQKAFIAVQFHPELLDMKAGNPQFGTQCRIAGEGDSGTECRNYTQPEICTKYGVGERVLRQAIELHRKIAGKKKLSEEVRMQVWAGFGLGGILSGLGGKEATGGKNRKPSDVAGVTRTLASYRSQIREFATWPRTHRVAFADELRSTIETSPEEVNDLLLALIIKDEAKVSSILDKAEGGATA